MTGADLGLIKVDRTDYMKVYDFNNSDPKKDSTSDRDINDPDAVKSTFSRDWNRYADKALVIDVANTSYDEDTAETTTLTSGQYGWVVFDESKKAVVVYVTETYKMEPDIDTDDEGDSNDLLASVVVNDATQYVPDAGYSSIRKAVENAEPIKMSTDSTQTYKIALTGVTLGAGEAWGNAGYFGDERAALAGSVPAITQALSTETNTWKTTGLTTVAEGSYIVIGITTDVSDPDATTYYAYTFVK